VAQAVPVQIRPSAPNKKIMILYHIHDKCLKHPLKQEKIVLALLKANFPPALTDRSKQFSLDG
jgi:hypothetical protein